MTMIPIPADLSADELADRLVRLARDVEDVAAEVRANARERDARVAIEATKAAALAAMEQTAGALVGTGALVPAAFLAGAAQAGADAAVRHLRDAGLLLAPGEVLDVRVVDLPPTTTVAEVVRDARGRILGMQVEVVPEVRR